jgi:5,10-methylene-tetrahydrofolate dehydrogenase/methenyl tetrahydrofolate cyclohydrolase
VAKILDGKAVAARIRSEVAAGVAELESCGVHVRLDVVLVGDDSASATYVRMKQRDCAEVSNPAPTAFRPALPKKSSQRSSRGSTKSGPSPVSLSSCRSLTAWIPFP